MKDINLDLRKAYYDLINGQISVLGQQIPVYYMFVPENYPEAYIVINSITSTGREAKCGQDTDTSIQFLISTRADRNNGFVADQTASQLMQLVYPNRQAVIDGTLSMELVSDITLPDYDPAAKKQIIERVITFSHIINQ